MQKENLIFTKFIFNYVLICIVLFWGDKDLLDAIIPFLMKFK